MTAPDWALWIGATLRAIPAPTESWAKIISALAWPALAAFFVLRYKNFVRNFLTTIADRLERDHLKLGLFEMTPNSEVIALDPDDADESTEHYTPEDITLIERLFEFISEPSGYGKLHEWLGENLPNVNMSDFLTEPAYSANRISASAQLGV